MNTTSISIRLTAAAFAAAFAVTFAGCAAADAASEADTSTISIDAGRGAVRFVPSDNDPRGHHLVRESASTVEAQGSAVDDDLSPLTAR